MKFFLDTANIDEIKQAYGMHMLDGVTTNPSLIAREKNRTGKKFLDIVGQICKTVGHMPVSVEVLKLKADEMIEEGLLLKTNIGGNVVIKLPCTTEALTATVALASQGVSTNLTLCFSPLQALLVAKAGASMVSPFVGRLDDIGSDGMHLVADIKVIYNNYRLPTEVLVASVRNPIHILHAARIGADIVTVPFSVIKQLMEHPLTKSGIDKFLEDAKEANTKKD